MKLDSVLRGKRVAIYGRHSTDKQDMDTQIATAQKLVDDYQCVVTGRYLDRGVSATKKPDDKRMELVRLTKDVIEGKFDVVITYNRDRLARNPLEHQRIRILMKEFGVPIVLASSETLYDTGDLISQLAFDGLTKFEVDQTRVRTRDAMKNFVREGRWTGGKPPYGYTYNERTGVFSKRPECVEVIHEIFDEYRRGGGFKTIADSLSNRNVGGRDWSKFDVKSIVTNPFYAGYVTFGKGKAQSHSSIAPREYWLMSKCKAIPPVISDTVWEACWKIYWDKRQGEKSPTDLTTTFLLKDLLVCSECETNLEPTNQVSRGKDGKTYGHRWYRCPNFQTCGTRVLVDTVHDGVFDVLFRVMFSKGNLFDEVAKSLQADERDLEEQINDLGRAIEDNEREAFEAQATMKRLMSDDVPDEKRKVILAHLQKYRLDLEARNRDIKAQIARRRSDLRHIQSVQLNPDLWDDIFQDVSAPGRNMTDAALRRLALYILEKVWINRKGDIENIRAKVDLEL